MAFSDPVIEPRGQNGVTPDMTMSPVKSTLCSGTQTTVSLTVWAGPGCRSSTARSPTCRVIPSR